MEGTKAWPAPGMSASFLARSFPFFPAFSSNPSCSKRLFGGRYMLTGMRTEAFLPSDRRKKATSRLCNVSGYTTELLEIHSEDPSLHILVVPGNPGVVGFYQDFVEAMYELLRGKASVTAIGHLSHTRKDWSRGKLFSLEEQINHKIEFIRENLQKKETPLILVGHSIGAYIALEAYKIFQNEVTCAFGVYPFLALNRKSLVQSFLVNITRSGFLVAAVSFCIAILGLLPFRVTRFFVRKLIGCSWSAGAVDVASHHLPRYNTMRNILYMAMTEFRKLTEEPDWTFIKENQNQLAFLFGTDDHWGPLSLLEEMSERAPETTLTVESEGHTHAFCCSEAGSNWVAHYLVRLIEEKVQLQL